jgi:hypothetical protein
LWQKKFLEVLIKYSINQEKKMEIKSMNGINPVFGTRFGPRLTKLLENNKEALHSESYKNLSNIRNNGIDSVLELVELSALKQQRSGDKYILQLHNSTIDAKNDIILWNTGLYRMFKDHVSKILSEKVLTEKSKFPITVKNTFDTPEISVIRQFDDKFGLVDKIESEYKQSKTIVDEFNHFREFLLKKYSVKRK